MMEKKNLQNLLDMVYELEALVHLALSREDSLADFNRLIRQKAKAVETLSNELALPANFDKKDKIEKEENQEIEQIKENEIFPLSGKDETINSLSEKSTVADSAGKGKLVFSLNDRFRFKKELFDNSDAEFNNNMAIVASMDSYEEAEDYFINEMEMDEKNPVVIDFLDIIKKYFA